MSCFTALTQSVQSQVDRIRNAFKQRREGSSTAAVKRQQIGLPRSVVKDEDPFGSMMSLNQGGDKTILLQEKARADAIAAARKAGGGGGGGFGHHPLPPAACSPHAPVTTTTATATATPTPVENYKGSRTSSTSTKVDRVEAGSGEAAAKEGKEGFVMDASAVTLEDIAFH